MGANICITIYHGMQIIFEDKIYILKILTVGLRSSDWVEKNSSNNRFKHFWNGPMHTNFGTMFFFFFHWFIGFFCSRNLMILYTRTHKTAKFIPDFILDRFVLVNYYGWSKQRQLHYKMILLHHPILYWNLVNWGLKMSFLLESKPLLM